MLSYSKLCDLRDFRDPQLRTIIREVFSYEIARFGPAFPDHFEYRKHWEIGMAVRTLSDLDVLHDRAEVLGVGAGTEATVFWLTNRVRRVFATDLYPTPGDWQRTARTSMLVDPARHSPVNWNPRRLVVQHMNALDLQYEDESFDGIFSSSSIEHFGTLADVGLSLDEMFRVLRPGGILTLSTEFRLRGKPPGLPGILMFDYSELCDLVIGDRDWTLTSNFDPELSIETRHAIVEFADAARDVTTDRDRWSTYPHVVLRDGDCVWTSVHLALRKS